MGITTTTSYASPLAAFGLALQGFIDAAKSHPGGSVTVSTFPNRAFYDTIIIEPTEGAAYFSPGSKVEIAMSTGCVFVLIAIPLEQTS